MAQCPRCFKDKPMLSNKCPHCTADVPTGQQIEHSAVSTVMTVIIFLVVVGLLFG